MTRATELESRGNVFTPFTGCAQIEITLPPNAPKEYADRATLWNAVEMSEKGQKWIGYNKLGRFFKVI